MNQPLRRRSNPVSLTKSRWAAYATAGAATALAGVGSAQADIHYSGPINMMFTPGSGASSFSLDNGAVIRFVDTTVTPGGAALFRIQGAALSNQFRGFATGAYRYVERVASNVLVSGGAFANFNGTFFATLAYGNGYGNSQFLTAGTGFIGFRFNGGSGMEYGWARVIMGGAPGNSFTLVDYAWADVGTPIQTGQVPEPGSLGLLAVGAAGLMAWRRRRAKAPVAANS